MNDRLAAVWSRLLPVLAGSAVVALAAGSIVEGRAGVALWAVGVFLLVTAPWTVVIARAVTATLERRWGRVGLCLGLLALAFLAWIRP